MANVVRNPLALLVTMLIFLSCGCSGDQGVANPEANGTRQLTASESETAIWLGRAYSESGAPDVFFRGFWMSDSAFYGDTQAWRCIFEHVVAALGTPERTSTLSGLVALAQAEPGFPTSHRDEIEKILATLPESERIGLGHQVIAGAEHCSDVRIGLFSGGGPVPVCIYDRTDADQRAEIVASNLSAFDRPNPGVTELGEICFQEIAEAYEAGETLDWIEDLERGYWEKADSTTPTTGTQPDSGVAYPPQPETRSVPSPEWIGLEYDTELDYETQEYYHLDVRTNPPTRLELFGGTHVGGFYSGFGIAEFYTEAGMSPEEPGDRLLLMVEDSGSDSFKVLDAIRVSQRLNERLRDCESPDADAVLALVYGAPESSEVRFNVIDAWALSAEGGFQPADIPEVRCAV